MIYKDPCNTCIVKVNCGQLCEEKKTYGESLPKISFLTSMAIYLTIIPITYSLIIWAKDLSQVVSFGLMILYICVSGVVYSIAITKWEKYIDKIKDINRDERNDIESVKWRRKGMSIPPRTRRFP